MDSGTTFGAMGRQHSPEEWEQHRSLIKRLYIDEKMPLPKLMLVMEESGFYATWVLSHPRFSSLFKLTNIKEEALQELDRNVETQEESQARREKSVATKAKEAKDGRE